jgi:hypothetical protein
MMLHGKLVSENIEIRYNSSIKVKDAEYLVSVMGKY